MRPGRPILDTNLTGMMRTYRTFAPPMIERGARPADWHRVARVVRRAARSGRVHGEQSRRRRPDAGARRRVGAAWGHGERDRAGRVRDRSQSRRCSTGPRGQEFLMRTPMRRFGRVDELVGAAVYLASDASCVRDGPTARGRRRHSLRAESTSESGARDQRARQRRDGARIARGRTHRSSSTAMRLIASQRAIPRGHKIALSRHCSPASR